MNNTNLSNKGSRIKWDLTGYDHYIGIDWSQVNIARPTRKDIHPKVIEWDESNVKLVKDYLIKGFFVYLK